MEWHEFSFLILIDVVATCMMLLWHMFRFITMLVQKNKLNYDQIQLHDCMYLYIINCWHEI